MYLANIFKKHINIISDILVRSVLDLRYTNTGMFVCYPWKIVYILS